MKRADLNLGAGLLLWCLGLAGIGTAHAESVEGVLQWVGRVELTTPVSGKISEVLVDVGARAPQGAPLLRLDARGFRARVQQAQSDVARARDDHEEAQRELERSQELFDRTVLSIHELQMVKIEANGAAATYKAAQAQLAQANLELEYSVVSAPFDALVLQRHAEPGQTVVTRLQTSPLLVVADAQRMQVQLPLTLARALQLHIGQHAMVRAGDVRYQGEIRRIGLEPVNMQEQQPHYRVDVEFTVPAETNLRAGQPARVELP